MPRTPAPLTVVVGQFATSTRQRFEVYGPQGQLAGTFSEEADARAFVALPALIEVLQRELAYLRQFTEPTGSAELERRRAAIEAALAQADGPKEQP
jgi:hypothetical protein